MTLPLDTIAQIVGFAVLVFLIGRAKPAPTPNGNALAALLAQLATVTAERDKLLRDLAALQDACKEQQRDVNALQRALHEAQRAQDYYKTVTR